jgi:SAM-dependent methyltransferase
MATAAAFSPRFETARCALCGSARQNARYRFDFGAESSAVVTCSDCGLGYTSPRPTPAALGAFYGDGYYSFKTPSAPQFSGRPPFKERLRRTIISRHLGYSNLPHADAPLPGFITKLLSRFLVMPAFRSDGLLLDVGCGSGERMLELESFGWKTRGLEFSQEAADAGRSAGLNIDVGDLTTAKIVDNSVATITFYHALEHVYSPVETLTAAFRALKPGGDLLIAVPNYGSSERRIFGKNWDWLQMPTHLFHYDRAHLEDIVQRAGFVDICTRYSFNGYSVNTRIFGSMKPVAEILLKLYALAAALLGDGKALTVTARKPS